MMTKRLLPLSAIGMAVFLAVMLIIYRLPYQANSVQIAASDWAMVKADGLRLGSRSVREDISLVLFDVKTAANLGHVRSYDDDIRLYRSLFNAGARSVYDTRSVAAADEENFEEVRPLFEAMRDIRDDGALMRDAYLGPDLLASTHPRYTHLLAQNVVNAHPHAIASIRSRYYPMFHLTSIGPRESAPLLIARHVWGVEDADGEAVGEQMRQSGVLTAWHQQAPELVPESNIPNVPYPIGDRSVIWYPFLTSTVLVPPAAFWVSYDPAVGDYQRFSYVDVLERPDAVDFDNQIVIVGFSPETDVSPDSYEVPSIHRKAAPAEVVAAAVQTLLDERPMRVPPRGFQIVVVALMCVGLTLLGGWLRPIPAVLASFGVLFAYFLAAGLAYRSGWYSDFAIAPAAAILSGFLGMVYSSWLSVRSRQRVVDLFGRYVPRAVVNQLMLKPELRWLVLGGLSRTSL